MATRRFLKPFFARSRLGSRYLATKELPTEADAVIVGGGSVGCSTFYHLTKYGLKNCVLLERDRLTSGTTWHTAGLLWNLRPNDIDIDLLQHTRKLISEILPEETGGDDAGWINNGGLFVATTKERLDEYKRLMTVGKAFGVDSFVLSPKETKELYPLLHVDDIYGCLHSPSDGLMDPSSWTAALTKMGVKGGGKVIEQCPVTKILTEETYDGFRKVVGVETPDGVIKTPLVINSAGAWGPKVAAMLGVPAPTLAYRHAYVITEGIEGIRNVPNVRDHDGAFYLRLQGDTLQVGGYEYNPDMAGDRGTLPDDFSFGLYNVNWEVCFGGIIEAACHRLPVLAYTGIKSEVCGPLSFTPDDKPLCGYAPGMEGFFMACGFDLGMMLGGGAGRELAKWVINGRPETHLSGWDIRRFNPKVVSDPRWLRERTHERFATMYKMVYAKDEPLAGRNFVKTPFHEELQKLGAFFQERHSWERAGWFDPEGKPGPVLDYDFYGAYDNPKNENYAYEERLMYDYSFEFPKHFEVIKNEALACRNQVVGFDMSYFGKFYITGPDSQKAVDWISSNDLRKPEGATVYTCMLNDQGGTEADLTFSVIASGQGSSCDPEFEGRGFYVAAGGGSAYHDWVHIQNEIYEHKFDVQLTNRTEDMGIMSVQGRNSRPLLQELAPDLDLSNEGFPFSTNQLAMVAGHKCRLLRLSFVGELGWELHIPRDSCVPIFHALMETGKKYGFRPAGYRAMEPLSAEKGYRFWDSDLRIDDTPLESAIAFTCKLKTDIPFKGRKAIENQKAKGIRKRIVCVMLDEQLPLFGLETVFRDGVPVGFTRRGEYAFALQKPIAYAYISRPDGEQIKPDWIRSGKYTLEAFGTQYPAQVLLKSPFDVENKRLKGIYD